MILNQKNWTPKNWTPFLKPRPLVWVFSRRELCIKPCHVGGIIIPNRHWQNHATLQSFTHWGQATLLLVMVIIFEGNLPEKKNPEQKPDKNTRPQKHDKNQNSTSNNEVDLDNLLKTKLRPSCCASQKVSVIAFPVTPGMDEAAFEMTLPSCTYKRRISDKVPSSVPSWGWKRLPTSQLKFSHQFLVDFSTNQPKNKQLNWMISRKQQQKTTQKVPWLKPIDFAPFVSGLFSPSIIGQELCDNGQGPVWVHLTAEHANHPNHHTYPNRYCTWK